MSSREQLDSSALASRGAGGLHDDVADARTYVDKDVGFFQFEQFGNGSRRSEHEPSVLRAFLTSERSPGVSRLDQGASLDRFGVVPHDFLGISPQPHKLLGAERRSQFQHFSLENFRPLDRDA